MCQFELSISTIEQAFPVVFRQYFAAELAQLAAMEADGLVVVNGDWISVASRGRLLIRNVCMVFDRYLAACSAGPRYSKTV
jgi:oxygen-independent coproporphyrinogen-3 oxidase